MFLCTSINLHFNKNLPLVSFSQLVYLYLYASLTDDSLLHTTSANDLCETHPSLRLDAVHCWHRLARQASPAASAFKPAGQISYSLDLIPGCPDGLTNLAEMLVPERGDVDLVLLPPGKIPPVVGFVFIKEFQVGGQQPGAGEVVDMDEGVRGDEALVVGPAGSKDDGHGAGGEGVSPELLRDVVGVLGVLEGQVELVG